MKKIKSLRVSYALPVYGQRELAAVNKVLRNPQRIVPGEAVKEFEKKIAHLFGKQCGVMVNSGSSANLLAIESLRLPTGAEVITPVLTFATTVAPLVQKGLVPVFVDVEPGTYIINTKQIKAVLSPKTRALFVPSLLGNIPDLIALKKIAKKYNLYFIEDSCDTLGARFAGRPTGYYSDISTTSFYASHIITTAGAGGMACFHDVNLARRALVLGSWGRDSTLFGVHEKSEDIKKRFAGKVAGQPYDAKFIFSAIGYNFQSAELNAAFGLEQLKRRRTFASKRQKNFAHLLNFFRTYQNFFILPRQHPLADTNWLSFPLTIKAGAPFSRLEITKYLEEHNIQTRPIFTGNILKQPGFQKIKHRASKGGYPVAEHIMQNGFLLGCHQGMNQTHITYLKEVLTDFLQHYL